MDHWIRNNCLNGFSEVDQTTPKATPKPKKVVSVVKAEYNKKIDEKPISAPSAFIGVDALTIATDIIIRHEGKLHLCAFKDNTRWSIGYGTKSYAGECITEQEALRRFSEGVKWRLDNVQLKYPNLTNYQQAAITSLYYNCNSCYLGLGSKITANSFRRWKTEQKFPGLVKRAKNERALFSLGVMY